MSEIIVWVLVISRRTLGNDGMEVMTNVGNGPCPLARDAVILQEHLIQRLDIGFISGQDRRLGVSLGRDRWLLDDR